MALRNHSLKVYIRAGTKSGLTHGMILNLVYYNTPPPGLNVRRPLRRDNGVTTNQKAVMLTSTRALVCTKRIQYLSTTPFYYTIQVLRGRPVHSTVYLLVRHND